MMSAARIGADDLISSNVSARERRHHGWLGFLGSFVTQASIEINFNRRFSVRFRLLDPNRTPGQVGVDRPMYRVPAFLH